MAKKPAQKTATYHADLKDARTLIVLAENKDGTVELGRVDGDDEVLVVGKCPQSDTAKVGHCTLNAPPAEAPQSAQ